MLPMQVVKKEDRGPLRFEEDIVQIRNDIINPGIIASEIPDEPKMPRRMVKVHLGVETQSNFQKKLKVYEEVLQRIREE